MTLTETPFCDLLTEVNRRLAETTQAETCSAGHLRFTAYEMLDAAEALDLIDAGLLPSTRQAH